jgi:hypothetical protein
MTEEQMKHYAEYAMMVKRIVSKWHRFGFLSEADRQRLIIGLNCMRMLCDSTYILNQDYANRHDTKIEELMNILDEVFESTNEKVVIFSQWMCMTYLVAVELEQRGIKFEYLHGGVPSEKRKDLFDRFNNDSDCRVFLSTDAGSTGLNLQSASVIINLDIPWNPAVLEQRIARVHRMGQQNKVSVINFVANHTIEHRMLFVLVFKSALSQGVLDHGEDAIFMDADTFTKFMETVEAVTEDMQDETVISAEEEMEPVAMGALPAHAIENDEASEMVALPPLAIENEEVSEMVALPPHAIESMEPSVESRATEISSQEAPQHEALQNEQSLREDLYQKRLPDDVSSKEALPENLLLEDEEADMEEVARIEGDDDVVPVDTFMPPRSNTQSPPIASSSSHPDPQDLLAGGLRFLSGLAQTLSSPDATQQLVSSLVERDEKTGRNYVKIPVDDQQTVANVMNLLGQLFKGFGK